MPDARVFIDTNVVLYLLSADARKADQAESVVRDGGVVSVQVLNEITNVARRKLSMSWADIHEFLTLVQALCSIEPLTLDSHMRGRTIAERYQLSVYDAMIVSSALEADCGVLYSEDMQGGLVIDDQLRIEDPFAV